MKRSVYANKITALFLVLLTVLLLPGAAFAEAQLPFQEVESPAWDHIISVVAGRGFTVGLRSDGRVAYAGDNNSDEIRKIGSWRDIVRIEHRGEHSPYVVGYRSDGSIALAFLDNQLVEKEKNEPEAAVRGWYQNRWTEADFEGWTDITCLLLDYYFALGLRSDGSVLAAIREAGQEPELLQKLRELKATVEQWESIRQIETYGSDLFRYRYYDYNMVTDAYNVGDGCIIVLAAGLRENGEMVTTDDSCLQVQAMDSSADFLQPWPEPSEWKHVRELVHGRYGSSMRPFLFAIREDGTVLGIVKEYEIPEYDGERFIGFGTKPYDHVQSMCFAMNEIYMLKDDGSVSVLTESSWDVDQEITTWTDISQLAGGTNGQFSAEGIPMGLRTDGRVLAVGNSAEEVAGWKEIKKLVVGIQYSIGISSDGKVVSFNSDPLLESWSDMIDIIPSTSGWLYGDEHYVGLKSDGTVVAAGDNTYGQCNVGG